MILITGGTGAIGTELIKILAKADRPIRAMVRNPAKAGSIAFPGVQIVEGDFEDLASLDAALSGVTKAFLLAAPTEHQLDHETNFLKAAANANLEHIVKLSAMGASPDSPSRFLRGHGEAELRLEESRIPWTHLRPNQFMQNLLGPRDSIIQRGEFYAPAGDAKMSIVDIRDIAAVAVEVLAASPAHEWKRYTITGPEALTYAEVAGRLSFEVGKPVAYVDVPPETARAGMLQSGMSEWLADGILELYALYKADLFSEVTDVVHHEGKKDPITFAQFAHDYAPQFGRNAPRDALGEVIDTLTLDNMTPGE